MNSFVTRPSSSTRRPHASVGLYILFALLGCGSTDRQAPASGGASSIGGSPNISGGGGAAQNAAGGREGVLAGGTAGEGAKAGSPAHMGGARGGSGGGGGGGGGGSAAGGSVSSGGATVGTNGIPQLHVDGPNLKDPAGNVVVLRGLDTVDLELLDGQRAPMNIMKLIDLLSDTASGWNARVLRFTVLPSTWNKSPDDYFTKYLKPAIDHATERKLYAIIDWHYIADPEPNAASTLAFWQYVAPKFAAQPNVLYELYNEPIKVGGGTSWASWKALAQPWVDAIRAAAPDNLVLIGGPQWSQLIGGSVADPFTGTNLVYVGHVYPQVASSLWKPGGDIAKVAGVHPLFITEWGYIDGGAAPTSGTQTGFGEPFKAWLTSSQASWAAWCADTSWDPKMFDAKDWNVLSGPGYMGQFVKDFLAETKDDHQAR